MRSLAAFLLAAIALVLIPVKAISIQQSQENSATATQKQITLQHHGISETMAAIASVTPIVTMTVAVFFGLLAWRFNERSIRRLARQDHIRMLIEIDKNLIERPQLWRIYKDEYTGIASSEETDPWESARRTAFIYLCLNMFEAVYDFDRHLNWRNFNWRTQSDKEYIESWKVFIGDLFQRSPEVVDVVNASRGFYSKGYVNFIDSLLLQSKISPQADQATTSSS